MRADFYGRISGQASLLGSCFSETSFHSFNIPSHRSRYLFNYLQDFSVPWVGCWVTVIPSYSVPLWPLLLQPPVLASLNS